jgi:hypothetical protein
MNSKNSAKKEKLATENYIVIIHFLNLPIGKLLQFNLINKRFYDEIIPDIMNPRRLDLVPDWNKWNDTKFDCSFRHRIFFRQYDKVYEIKELDDQLHSD